MAFGGSFVKEIVIIDALRTPVGRYDGALAEYSAAELGTHVVSNLLSKHENIVVYLIQCPLQQSTKFVVQE